MRLRNQGCLAGEAMKEGRTLTAQTAGGKVATTQMAKTIEVSKNEAGVHLEVNRNKETTLKKVAMAIRNQISEANLRKERLGPFVRGEASDQSKDKNRWG
jgi:ribosomal protein S17